MNGTKGEGGGGGSHHGHHSSKHGSKRSKSKERKQRSGGWWSSDDNLDSDSTYRTPSVMSRHHHGEHASHCYPDSMHSHFGDLSLKTSKSNNDVKCSACESIAMAPEGKFMKRSSWPTLTVSQAKEAYRKSSLNLEKPMIHTDLKPSLRACHYLQVSALFQGLGVCVLSRGLFLDFTQKLTADLFSNALQGSPLLTCFGTKLLERLSLIPLKM